MDMIKLFLRNATLAAALLLMASLAHAESIMPPMDDHGQLVDSHMPFADSASPEQKFEWLRRQGTARCSDTSYHLEQRSTGLTCVRPSR
jgi:hypothetical protein